MLEGALLESFGVCVFVIEIDAAFPIHKSQRLFVLVLLIRPLLVFTTDLQKGNLLVFLFPELRRCEFLLLLRRLYALNLLDFLAEVVVLLLDARVLVGDAGVVCKYVVEFVVDGEMVGPHLVVQILVVLLYLCHFCISRGLLDSSAKRFL